MNIARKVVTFVHGGVKVAFQCLLDPDGVLGPSLSASCPWLLAAQPTFGYHVLEHG